MTHNNAAQSNRLYIGIALIILLLVAAAGIYFFVIGNAGRIALTSISGVGYTSSGTLTVAAADGVWSFDSTVARWTRSENAQARYIGYSTTQNGFYLSGYAADDTLLGLQRSIDTGETITTVRFANDRVFPQLAAGYQNTNVVYIYTAEVNDDFAFGMHYSLDGGVTWQAAAMSGAPATLFDIAVHPTDDSIIAIATGDEGAYLSRDYGATFQRLSNAPAVSVAFDPANGDTLYFAFQVLSIYTLSTGNIQDIGTPLMNDTEAVTHIAADPLTDTVAIATSESDLYQWDGTLGGQWRELVAAGITQ